jgi:hypothetical protein
VLTAVAQVALVGAVQARALPPAGSPPAAVAAWWESLSPDGQRAERLPDGAGRLDGLPFGVRDAVNRRVLAAADRRKGASRDVIAAVRARLDEHPGSLLVDLDVTGSGRAVIALGDVEGAEHVAVLVPGMNTHVSGQLRGLVADAARVRDTAERLAVDAPGASVATLAWIGYDAPGARQVAFAGRARAGAPALRSLLRGLDDRATLQGREADLTVVAHSYGTVVTAAALTEPTGADRVVMAGSPGTDLRSGRQLVLPDHAVFVDEAAGDWVARSDWFTGDPSERSFGARRLQNDGGTDPVLGELGASRGHSAYYRSGSESLRNIAEVVLDREERASYD